MSAPDLRPERTLPAMSRRCCSVSFGGRRAAQQKGVRFGRPPALSAEQVALGQRLLAEGTSVREAAHILRCHHATLYRAIRTRAPVSEGA